MIGKQTCEKVYFLVFRHRCSGIPPQDSINEVQYSMYTFAVTNHKNNNKNICTLKLHAGCTAYKDAWVVRTGGGVVRSLTVAH
jgi:hypothetical protein